ncbi:unnamed protein product [Medioppia subpectinata]|uniref:Farnesyl pyrophosphate synthase n=1 Tax=Medioppia subpectinata TaxID=1979941 RepID=A0A7R9QAJ0_9ACAR|nr:unnamed protein product [Medioppia subpectinata]CAG2117492.1 unnamed protein product [Medioppia subpectinata]
MARVLAWTVEFLQAFFLVVDDLIDESITRRGQPCWYKLEHVGLISCNDAILLDQENYHILKLFFSDKPYYQKLVDLMHEVSCTRYTAIGQSMDMASNPPNKRPQFHVFTQLRYDSIVKYKTAFYSFVLPVRLALYMSSFNSEEDHKIAEEILLKIGHLFQVQDDYLDCFGDPAIIGKIGTDIEEGKCSWLIVTAFQMCDKQQREFIETNYGIKDGDCVRRVKEFYNKLNLKDVFHKEEEKQYKEINVLIDNLKAKSQLSPKIFTEFLNRIYKRKK